MNLTLPLSLFLGYIAKTWLGCSLFLIHYQFLNWNQASPLPLLIVLPTTIFQGKWLSICTSIDPIFNTQFSRKGFWTLSCTTKLICISSGDTPSFQAFLPKLEPFSGGGDFGGHIFVGPQIYYSQILHKIHHAPIVPKFRFGKKGPMQVWEYSTCRFFIEFQQKNCNELTPWEYDYIPGCIVVVQLGDPILNFLILLFVLSAN